jgi:phosphonate transport system permease protein
VSSADPATRLEQARRDHQHARRRQSWVTAGLAVLTFGLALPAGGFSLDKLIIGFPQITAYVGSTLPVIRIEYFAEDIAEWYWGLGRYLQLMADTVLMAYLGTLLGLIGALVLAFPASANLARWPGLRFVSRRILEFARSVPELVYALIFVFAFGIGPVPGVLALAVHSMGALGKLFSEVNENLDDRAIAGVTATGASWFAVMRLAVMPQVLPNYASYTLFRFEINVRSASVLGFVGAGGIGQELYTSIRSFSYTDVSAIVLVIIVMVSLTDLASQTIRTRFLDRETIA